MAVLPQNFFPKAITQVILSVGAPGGEPVLNCLYNGCPGDDPEVAIVECTFELPVSPSGVLEIGWSSDLQYTKKEAIDRFVQRGVLRTFPVAVQGKHSYSVMNLYHLEQCVRVDEAFSVQVMFQPQNYWPNAITQIWLYIKDLGSGNDSQYDIVPIYNGCPGDDPTPNTFGCAIHVKEHFVGPIEVGWATDMQYTFKDAVDRFPAWGEAGGSKIKLGVVNIVKSDEEFAQHMTSYRDKSSRRLGANAPSSEIKQRVTSKMQNKVEDHVIKQHESAGRKDWAVITKVSKKLRDAVEDVKKQADRVFEKADAAGKDVDEIYELVNEALVEKTDDHPGYISRVTYPGWLDRLYALAAALTEGKKTHREIKDMLQKSERPNSHLNSAQQEILDYAKMERKNLEEEGHEQIKNYVAKKSAKEATKRTVIYGASPSVARGLAKAGVRVRTYLSSDYLPVAAEEAGAVTTEAAGEVAAEAAGEVGFRALVRQGALSVEEGAVLAGAASSGAVLAVGVVCWGGELVGEVAGKYAAKATGIDKQTSIEGGKLAGAVFAGAAAGSFVPGLGTAAGALLGVTGWAIGEIVDSAPGMATWVEKEFSCFHW